MKKWLLQGSEGILSALTPAAEIAAPRGRVTATAEDAREEVANTNIT
jgi:hypothetical protein